MTREQDEACAKALGIEGAINGRPCYFVPGYRNAFFVPPVFSEDLRWARMLEDEMEKRGLLKEYAWVLYEQLGKLVSAEGGYISMDDVVLLLRAAPEQRARAFLEAVK